MLVKVINRQMVLPGPDQHVGIDISAEYWDACIRVDDSLVRARFSLVGAKGFSECHKWLKKHDVQNPHFVMEATGRYWTKLAQWAQRQRWKVTVQNPRCIRKYADSKLQSNKTDALDAEVILRFAEASEPGELRLWRQPSKAGFDLKDVQLEITGMKKMIGQERNRLKCGLHSDVVKRTIRDNMVYLRTQIKALYTQALMLIETDEQLQTRYDQLLSIKGFGIVTVVLLLAKIDFDAFEKGRQLVKFAGLEPVQWQSGKSIRKKDRILRVGHADLRCALYLPAVVAMTHDVGIREFVERHAERKTPAKVVICAVMARLLRTAFSLVRDDRKYTEVRTKSA